MQNFQEQLPELLGRSEIGFPPAGAKTKKSIAKQVHKRGFVLVCYYAILVKTGQKKMRTAVGRPHFSNPQSVVCDAQSTLCAKVRVLYPFRSRQSADRRPQTTDCRLVLSRFIQQKEGQFWFWFWFLKRVHSTQPNYSFLLVRKVVRISLRHVCVVF